MKVDKNIYKKLAKIKKPAMIWVELKGLLGTRTPRLRILQPDGFIEYSTLSMKGAVKTSCFCSDSLESTVRHMSKYDRHVASLVITAVEYL